VFLSGAVVPEFYSPFGCEMDAPYLAGAPCTELSEGTARVTVQHALAVPPADFLSEGQADFSLQAPLDLYPLFPSMRV